MAVQRASVDRTRLTDRLADFPNHSAAANARRIRSKPHARTAFRVGRAHAEKQPKRPNSVDAQKIPAYPRSSQPNHRSAPENHATGPSPPETERTRRMAYFTGAHVGRLDTKGRILVPKPFRDLLRSMVDLHAPSLRLRPSENDACVEGWPIPEYDATAARAVTKLDGDEDAIRNFNIIFHWPTLELEPDGDGRIKLPASLIAHANLGGDVLFLGTGNMFELWSKDAAVTRLSQAADFRATKALPLVASGDA